MTIPRRLLADYFGGDPRLVKAFEEQSQALEGSAAAAATAVAATEAIQDATVITLSANASFANERVLRAVDGVRATDTGSEVRVTVDATVARAQGGEVRLVVPASGSWFLPLSGVLVTRESTDRLSNKTLMTPALEGLVNAADDSAAAAASVPVGGVYHNAGALRVRLV